MNLRELVFERKGSLRLHGLPSIQEMEELALSAFALALVNAPEKASGSSSVFIPPMFAESPPSKRR